MFYGQNDIRDFKMDLQEIGWAGMDWLHLAQDRKCLTLVNAIMNLRFAYNAGYFLTA
jgi:hypothetical protein